MTTMPLATPTALAGDQVLKSGFTTIVGRPNSGKSTLLNQILRRKVTIVSDKPNTTRTAVRGVLHGTDHQVVFVDTPGLHRPRTLLGERLNETAHAALADVDATVFVLDAQAPLGRGDLFIAEKLPSDTIVVVNKVDRASPEEVLRQLQRASALDMSAYFPVSALSGEGVPELVEEIVARMPEGPPYYPPEVVSDVPEAAWVAELVREQLLIHVREELPHSIACRVTEWEWPVVRVEILVERDSQKGIVIGKGGSVLKAVGTAVRAQMAQGCHLELFVKIDKDWQTRASALERLGL